MGQPLATKVRDIHDPGFQPKTLYRLSRRLGNSDYAIVYSSPADEHDEAAVFAMPANERGEHSATPLAVLDSTESHSAVFEHLGFVLAAPVHAFTDEPTHVDEIGDES